MINTIYVEEAALDNDRTQRVLERLPRAEHIVIERYAEVFNSHSQNFRLQKQQPALVLAVKGNKRVLPAPQQYETGGGANYYFSHMLNCLYDCRYCFLQGMYRSANYLLFVNYEDFFDDIERFARHHSNDDKPAWFFSGYDCDSLALEPVTGFAESFLPLFASNPQVVLELRTKSTQIRSLLNTEPLANVVVAFSLSPESVARALEAGAPSLSKRLRAMQKLQDAGWRIGVRFDPVIWHRDYQIDYRQLVDKVFTTLDESRIDSVTLGGFRLPKNYFKTMRKLYPEHWLFSSGLDHSNNRVCYRRDIEAEMFEFIQAAVLRYTDPQKLYVYPSHIESETR